jgi:glycine/D-amino acid oxidase-like deaminating enzyme
MRIAVIGAGIAGLAVAYHLLKKGAEVTLYDGGPGASHASTGLLYPCPGRMAGRTWQSKEGMAATLELIDAAESALGLLVADRSGILRLPWAEWQKKAFLKHCRKSPDQATWTGEGMFIPSGMTVFSKRYLAGLKKACARARLITAKVENLSDIQADRIILATGAETTKLANLPLTPVKGQALLCRWKDPLPYSLVGNGHITRTEDPHLCLIGSTYEHNFISPHPDPNVIPELLAKAAAFHPPAKDYEVIDVIAGIRMAPSNGTRPMIEQLDARTWVMTGFGSRGLLYHALLAKKLVGML